MALDLPADVRMKALQFSVSVPRYALGKVVGPLYAPIYYGPLSCLQLRDVPEPVLPGPEWVKIKTRYGGICGSDLNTIRLHVSPAMTPFTSQSFTLGHEQVGTIMEIGDGVHDFAVGQRVVVDPILPCPVRGIDPPCPACQSGDWSRCQNFAEGNISPGMQIGLCADTGGSWGSCFVAHEFQLFALPEEVSEENGVMVEPFATALHAVMRCFPADQETVLIMGAGVIGLSALAALRCLGSRARTLVLARYPFQAELAETFGADSVIVPARTDYYQAVALATGARLYQPVLGKRMMMGGADVVYDCVGSDTTLDDALRLVRAGGRLSLVGLIGQTKKVDWTPLWFRELHVTGSNCACALETLGEERVRSFELAIRWMAQGKLDLAPLLTHRFPLTQYGQALAVATSKRANRAVKVAFEFADERGAL